MAKTIEQLKAQGAEVKHATVVGENTATRVGTLFTDIIEYIEQVPADGTITTEKLAPLAITTEKIANGAVTIEKLADSAIDDKPTAESNNMVKSGGVYPINIQSDALYDSYQTLVDNISDVNDSSPLSGETTIGRFYNFRTKSYENNSQFRTVEYQINNGNIYIVTGRTYGTDVRLGVFLDSSNNLLYKSPSSVDGTVPSTITLIAPHDATKLVVSVYDYLPSLSVREITPAKNFGLFYDKVNNIIKDYVNYDNGRTISDYEITQGKYVSFSSHTIQEYSEVQILSLDVNGGDFYHVEAPTFGNDVALCNFYDSSDNYISNSGKAPEGFNSVDIQIPSSAVKMIINTKKNANNINIIKAFVVPFEEKTNLLSIDLYGKKINFLGDSITEGYLTNKTYYNYLKDRFGFIPVSYGIGGSTIARYNAEDTTKSMALRYENMEDADMIVVAGGTNDKGRNIPIGVFDDNTVDTFYGALHVLIKGLMNKYINKPILFMTPPQCLAFDSKLYADAIKDVCKYYSVPVVDVYYESGITRHNAANASAYLADNIHPNTIGHYMISKVFNRYLI